MKAVAIIPDERTVRIVDHPAPGPCEARQVKLDVLEVGVCGTDKEICRFEYGAPTPDASYLITGHEALGRVIEIGPLVERVKIGELVIPTIRRPCSSPSCRACRTGHQDFCATNEYTERGIHRAHGFLTEQIVEEEFYLTIAPASLREVAILAEPLTVTEKALGQYETIQRRLPWTAEERPRRALVFGAGPVGLLAAMALRLRGFETYVYSRESSRHHKALIVRQIGAAYFSSEELSPADLSEEIGAPDLIYEATGASAASFRLLSLLGANGVYIFTGIPGDGAPSAIDTDRLMRGLVLKNQIVLGTVNATPADFGRAVADLERFVALWPAAVRNLITGRFEMKDYYSLALGDDESVKNVVVINA